MMALESSLPLPAGRPAGMVIGSCLPTTGGWAPGIRLNVGDAPESCGRGRLDAAAAARAVSLLPTNEAASAAQPSMMVWMAGRSRRPAA
jgi:hypothetical protein